MSYNPQNPNGQATMANSAPVVIASNQSALPITDNSGSLTVDQPTASNLNAQVVGDIAAGVTDGGNPVKVGGKFNSTQPTLTDGQRGNLELNSRGELKVAIVQGTQTANTTGSFADGSTNTTGAVNAGAYGKVFNGSTWDRQKGDTTGTHVTGPTADDATTLSSPVMIGGQAKESDGTDPGSVSAEDDVARAIFDRNRRQYVNTVHPNLWKVNENHSSAQTNNQLKAAPGANLSLYITDLIISNGATAGTVKIVEDEGGTPVDLLGPYYFAINGGLTMHFATPIRLTANKTLGFTSATVTTHTVSLNGYIAP